MGKLFKRKRGLKTAPADVDIAGLMDTIQSQLGSLDRKLDTLISQSSSRPSQRQFSDRPFGRSHDRGREERNFRQRSMTQVICADCGKDCEVPFKPSSDRPVYCKECFAKRKGGGSFGEKRDNNFGGQKREFKKGKKPFSRRKRR